MTEYNYSEGYKSLMKSIISSHRWKITLALLVFVVKHSPVLALPILIGRLIDLTAANPATRMHMLTVYGSIMVILVVQNIITHTLYIKLTSAIARRIGMDLRTRMCTQLQQLSILYHVKANVGRLHSKIIRDIEVIENALRYFIETFFSAGISIAVAITAVIMRSPVTLLFFIALAVLGIGLQKLFHKAMRNNIKQLRTSIESMSAGISDMMTMIPVTRAHGLEKAELENVRLKISDVFHKGLRFDMVVARFGAMSWVSFMVSQAAFLIIAVYFSFQGKITVGDIVMFNALFASCSNAISTIVNTLPEISKIKESGESVIEILNRPDIEHNKGKKIPAKVDGDFEFVNASFVYPGSVLPALHNISLKIEPGKSIAIVGPSGCGKTTFLYMVLGFARPTGGKVLLDGVDMNELDLRAFRAQVGVVAQESVFFSGSIRDNIAYGNLKIKDEDIIEALKLANAWEFVEKLPHGIRTQLGESGTSFSGGQKQRLAIARALLRKPRVLILDEATSQLDLESEKLIQNSLDHIMKKQTTFIVSHRLSIVRKADIIVVMDNGKIIEKGNHDMFLKSDNFYSRAQSYMQS